MKKWVCYEEFCNDLLFNLLGILLGKIEIFFDVVVKMNYDDCKGYLIWMEYEEFLGKIIVEELLVLVILYLKYCLYS